MNYLSPTTVLSSRSTATRNDQLAVDTLQKIYDEVWGEGVYKCWRSVRAGCLRRRQHPLHYAAGAVRLTPDTPPWRSLVAYVASVRYALVRANLAHLSTPSKRLALRGTPSRRSNRCSRAKVRFALFRGDLGVP